MNGFEVIGAFLCAFQVLAALLVILALPRVVASGGGAAIPLLSVMLDLATAIWIWRVIVWQA